MLEILYNHYIRLNSQNEIIHSFSDAFEQPKETDILLYETEERHCRFQVMSDKYIGKYKYKYIDGKIIEKSEEELYPIEEIKLNKIKEIKNEANRLITNNYPIYKQINLISGMNIKDTKAKKDEMSLYINTIRDKLDLLEIEVEKCNKKEDINNINIKF
jgi:predicted PolB exonuclease-like 3'-5' exonuclease